ncbi:MAG: hypothetical protein S4CHLAM45_00260 [Chlamydiales bacterium]|nr:hypothetical protein [Chlamydiales bacterium]MCH9619351.1 hypothetical protein [Chlamydiales bacterium]MCH9622155.1 hypothetical protein [Chlamydiales bacterium]
MISSINKNKISHLISKLKGIREEKEKIALLQKELCSNKTTLVELSLLAIGQEHLLPVDEKVYLELDRFYAPIGGLIGYHTTFLELIEGVRKKNFDRLSPVLGPDLREESFVEEGILAIPEMGEIYPVGGLGSRLDFRAEDGTPLPAALLPFAGYSLLEGLIRDVEAKEHLYFQRFGKKVTIPIALMTSEENQKCVLDHCEERGWFSRPKESFRFFSQLMTPIITKEGEWTGEMAPNGHGALWHTAYTAGVFDWFQKQGKKHLLIRQINNPIGGVDGSLLSLLGYGALKKKTFGFASCDRLKGAAEGVLVLVDGKCVSNIEYTELADEDLSFEFPANTNLLYANIEKILPIITKHPLQGLLVNMKNTDRGRLESMMQSISDVIDAKESFVTYNARHKTISATKRKFQGDLLETPQGALFDQMRNGYELLKQCGFELPPMVDKETFLKEGAAVHFTYKPTLGPLYSMIEQKLKGGRIAKGSTLNLEIADVYIENLDLDGSLTIVGNGRCSLKNVTIHNRGKEPLVLHVDNEYNAENQILS